MAGQLSIMKIEPTVFLRGQERELMQLVRVRLINRCSAADMVIRAEAGGQCWETQKLAAPQGESSHDIFVGELRQSMDIRFTVLRGGEIEDSAIVPVPKPRRWKVHVVQASHLDAGYTDLACNVERLHLRYLDEAIDMAGATDGFPDDARFRILIEQAWPADAFVRHAPPARAERLLELLRSGRFEVTALFGNMVTEICSHEALIRSLYHAFRLKRLYGVPLLSAENNDITGFGWGLCEILAGAGIRLFCPGVPKYYSWADLRLRNSWDDRELFGEGVPGAFWWEAASGARVLLWCNNSGCGGDARVSMPGLPGRLMELEESGYAYSVLRWPVGGAAADNAPYSIGYAQTIREWNEKWAYPKLVCSTNAKFYADFIREDLSGLPVFRGEFPGQDYPPGSVSTARATALARNAMAGLPCAEAASAFAQSLAGAEYPAEPIFEAYEQALWHCEHTWGHYFPCGPAAEALEKEKALHAHKAAALCHDVRSKALAALADKAGRRDGAFALVVFNMTPQSATGPVVEPMREMDCLSQSFRTVPVEKDPLKAGYRASTGWFDRWPAPLPDGLLEGRFRLVDEASGEEAPFQISAVDGPDDAVPYAAGRLGGSANPKYNGLDRDLVFVASDVPAFGYRTYRLEPADKAGSPPRALGTFGGEQAEIENEYYRITAGAKDGKAFVRAVCKEDGREIFDSGCPWRPGELVVRAPFGEAGGMQGVSVRIRDTGPVRHSVELCGRAHGHPRVRQVFSLYAGVDAVYFDCGLLKDSTPLLDAHIAFPFALSHPKFRYEGGLAVMNPVEDYLPGSYWDAVAMQTWAKASGTEGCALLSSPDAPMAEFGGLWPGYVSQAHRCVIGGRAARPRVELEDIDKGWIFSNIENNNFMTNFASAQTGELLFRYRFSTRSGGASDGEAAAFGFQSVQPLEAVFSRETAGGLPAAGGFVETEGGPAALLACKRAEDGNGFVLRFWNPSRENVSARVRVRFAEIGSARLLSIAEEDAGADVRVENSAFDISLAGNGIVSVRVVPRDTAEGMIWN